MMFGIFWNHGMDGSRQWDRATVQGAAESWLGRLQRDDLRGLLLLLTSVACRANNDIQRLRFTHSWQAMRRPGVLNEMCADMCCWWNDLKLNLTHLASLSLSRDIVRHLTFCFNFLKVENTKSSELFTQIYNLPLQTPARTSRISSFDFWTYYSI